MSYRVMRMLAFGVGSMSDKTIDRIAQSLGFLAFHVFRVRRHLVLENLGRAFPDMDQATKKSIARASYYHFALTCLEFVRAASTDLAAKVEIRGSEHLKQAVDSGKGAYILALHLGNWEAMGASLSRQIAPTHVVVKKVGSESMNRFVEEVRDRSGFCRIERNTGGDALRAIIKALRKGEVIGYVMDQSRPGSPRLPFFGHGAKTNTGLATLWRRYPAPVIPGYIHRSGVSRHVVELLPPLNIEASENREGDVLKHTALFNETMEHMIRKHPEQYFWLHRRWK